MPAIDPLDAGIVYFVRRQDGAIKIGTTRHLPSRLKAITLKHGSVEVLASHPGDSRTEAALHRELAQFRLDGEWFSPTDEVISATRREASLRGDLSIDSFLVLDHVTADDVRRVTRTMLAEAVGHAGNHMNRSEVLELLAADTGVSVAWIRRLLRGEAATVTPDILDRIANHFRACCEAAADRARKQISVLEQKSNSADRLMRLFDRARPEKWKADRNADRFDA